MQFMLVTPEKTLFEGEAAQANLPGALGVFGVLPQHEQTVSLLKAGTATVILQDGTEQKFALLDGVAEVTADAVKVLCEVAKPLAGISLEEAKAAVDAAKTTAANDDSEDAARALKLAEVVLAGVAA